MSEVIAGFMGDPDDAQIPNRSWQRIMRAIFDLEDRHSNLNRQLSVRAICDTGGRNVSEVCIKLNTMDGRQLDDEVRLVYRGGLFYRATIYSYGEEWNVRRLSEALHHVDNPPVALA